MKNNYREGVYDNYLDHLKNFHSTIEKEEKKYRRYYDKNVKKSLPLNKDAFIVDLGCGMGHMLNYLRNAGFTNTLGVDISESNVKYLTEKNYSVIKADLLSYLNNCHESSIDCVISFDVIEHLTKEEAVQFVKLIYSRLKKGGMAIIKTDNMSNPILANDSRYMDITHEVCYTEISLKEIFVINSFDNVHVTGLNIYVFYENPLNYVGLIASSVLNVIFRLLFFVYGRSATKIFGKDILAVAYK